jgi:hypothetical protein
MTSRATARTAPSGRGTGTSPRSTSRTTARTTPNRAAPTRTTPTRTVTPSRSTPRPDLRLVPGPIVVRPRRRSVRALRHRRAPFVLLVVALLVGTTLGLLVLNTAIAVDSLKATHLRVENAERAQEVQRLEQQVVEGSTPAEIARAAVGAGLVPAGPAGYLVIEPGGGSVLRGAPQPAPEPGDAEGGD